MTGPDKCPKLVTFTVFVRPLTETSMFQQGLSFRRMEWRMWRHSYINQIPEAERLAWIRPTSAPAGSNDSQLAPALVQDISLGGINLNVSRKIESGAVLKVELPSFHTASVELLARVLHVKPLPNGTNYLLVCCFARELSDDDLQQFGARRERPETDDGRAWVRFPCSAETSIHQVLGARQEQWQASIVNISAGGVGLIVQGEIDLGTLLSVELKTPHSDKPRHVMVRIVHCEPLDDGTCRLGCTFVDELKDEDLRSLV